MAKLNAQLLRCICWSALLLVSARTTSARLGLVETRDGRTLRGQIRFSTNGVTLINADNETLTTISPTNLLELSFDPSSLPRPDPLDPRTGPRSEPEWQNRDIGSMSFPGGIEKISSVLRVRTSGTNITGTADAFHFMYRPCTGNCEMVARVVSIEPPGGKTGLMIRQSVAPDSPNVFVGLTGRRGGVLQRRATAGGDSDIDPNPALFVPHWLRLKRIGNEFTAYSSADGAHWLRSQTVPVMMTESACIGFAAATAGEQTMMSATFDNVRQDRSVPQTSFIPQLYLQSGSMVVGPISSGDSQRFEVESFPGTIPASSVTHLLFRWLPDRYAGQLSTGRSGVLLTTGEFIEGEFNRLDHNVLTMSSVLYGIKTFDADAEVLAIILRRPYESASRYTLATINGSIIRPRKIEFGNYEIALTESSLGPRKISLPEVLWLRCGRE